MEMASILSGNLIESLLNVHALTNMHRSSGNEEYRKGAANWLPSLERQFESLKHELTKEMEPSGRCRNEGCRPTSPCADCDRTSAEM